MKRWSMNLIIEHRAPLYAGKLFCLFSLSRKLTKFSFRIAPRRHSEQNPAAQNAYSAYAAMPSANYRNSYSPTPYGKPSSSVIDIRGHFNNTDAELNGRVGVYKKRAAPQPPKPQSHMYHKYPAPQPQRDWEPRSRGEYAYEQPRVDPIKELQAIGRARQEEVL